MKRKDTMTTTSEQSWPKSFPDLERLENLLRCGICYEFMKTALITPCSHNFCSICIRQYMQYKTSCPACLVDTVETQLRNNRTLDEVIGILERLKDPLCQALNENIPNNVSDENPHSVTATSCKTYTMPPEICDTKIPSSPSSSFETSNITLFDDEVSASPTKSSPMKSPTLSHEAWPVVSTPKSASFLSVRSSTQTVPEKVPARSIKQMLMSSVDKAGPSSTSVPPSPQHCKQPAAGSTVSCPKCNVNVPEKNIHRHLDFCLKSSDQPPVARKAEQKSSGRCPMPKLVYNLLSERDIKKRLADLRLSTQGDRKTLERRHQKYTLLYNSECDSVTPRPVSELVKQVERDEKEASKSNCRTLTTLQVDRKAHPTVIEEAQKKYRTQHKSSFDALLADLNRRQTKNKTVSTSSASTSTAPSTSTSTSNTSSNSPSSTQSAAPTPSLQAQSPSTPKVKQQCEPSWQRYAGSPSLLSEAQSPPCSPIVQAQMISPSILPHSRSPSIANSPVGINSLIDHQKAIVKSPIFSKRRLFETYETNHTNKISTVIEISDDSDGTNFSDTDFAQIDALTQQNVSLHEHSQSVSAEPPAVISPLPKPKVPESESSSDGDAEMFQAPKSKTPQVKRRQAKKRQKPDEPRRSKRKKPPC